MPRPCHSPTVPCPLQSLRGSWKYPNCYSLNLVPSNYHLFPGLEKQLKGRHFSSDMEVIAATETWLDGQTSEFFFEWLAKVRATGCEVY
jgi:hypothetical protein